MFKVIIFFALVYFSSVFFVLWIFCSVISPFCNPFIVKLLFAKISGNYSYPQLIAHSESSSAPPACKTIF